MSSAWEKELRDAEKTALIKDNRRKIHFVFTDKSEMVEEYDMACSQLFGMCNFKFIFRFFF